MWRDCGIMIRLCTEPVHTIDTRGQATHSMLAQTTHRVFFTGNTQRARDQTLDGEKEDLVLLVSVRKR